MYDFALFAGHLFLYIYANMSVCLRASAFSIYFSSSPRPHFNIFNAKILADTAYRWVKGILKQGDEMRDVQNVDIAHAPHFRSGILRVDDRVQDAKSFAKSMRACEREKEKARLEKNRWMRIAGAMEISIFLKHCEIEYSQIQLFFLFLGTNMSVM